MLIEPEDTITGGLQAGTAIDAIHDGWDVAFSSYVVAVGGIELALAGTSRRAASAEVFVIDLHAVSASGIELWSLDGLEQGRWELGYRTPRATSAARRHESVSAADLDAMVAGGLTYLIRGTLARSDGASCPPRSLSAAPALASVVRQNAAGEDCYANPSIDFELAAPAPTRYGPCEIDGVPGVAIASGAAASLSVTLHGDHLFFNGFPEGGEGGVTRLAQWLADSDLDVDGTVERSELERIPLAGLSELDGRYQLGGSPITPLETVWDYVVAQLHTQGHYQGEGECAISVDAAR